MRKLLLAAAVLLSMTACGGKTAESSAESVSGKAVESTGESTAARTAEQAVAEEAAGKTGTEVIEVTDLKGRTVKLPAKAERVVVTFNLEEYLAVTGAEGVDKLAGWSHSYWKGRRDDAYKAYTEALPKLASLPDVGYNGDISVEAIISLQPDVVLASATSANYNALEPSLDLLHEAGIEVVFLDFHKQTIETHQKSIELIGKVMGQEERAAELAKVYADEVNLVYDRLKGLSDEDRPSVYMEFSRGPGIIGNSWSEQMWGAQIRACGGVNIAAGQEGASVDVPAEQVLSANPDFIILSGSPQTDVSDNVVLGYGADRELAREHLEAYKNRDGWDSLNAVKNNNMGAIYHDLSRHIFDFAGTQFLAKMLHPELFEDVDPEANLAEFFSKYMPVELEGVWMLQLKE